MGFKQNMSLMDRKPVSDITKSLVGKVFGDRGYISQKNYLRSSYERELQLVKKSKKKMKNRFVKLIDKILLRKDIKYLAQK